MVCTLIFLVMIPLSHSPLTSLPQLYKPTNITISDGPALFRWHPRKDLPFTFFLTWQGLKSREGVVFQKNLISDQKSSYFGLKKLTTYFCQMWINCILKGPKNWFSKENKTFFFKSAFPENAFTSICIG